MKCKICEREAEEVYGGFCDICSRIIKILKTYTNIYKEPQA